MYVKQSTIEKDYPIKVYSVREDGTKREVAGCKTIEAAVRFIVDWKEIQPNLKLVTA